MRPVPSIVTRWSGTDARLLGVQGTAKGGFIDAARELLQQIAETQDDALDRASRICTDAIAAGGLAHAFGTGHSRIPVEELFPRYGSFPGSTRSSSSR